MKKSKKMLLRDVPVGGVFIGKNKDFFCCETRTGEQAYVKTRDDGEDCFFDDIDGRCVGFIGHGWVEVVFTGEMR